MSISVTFNGANYSIPSPGEVDFATSLNLFLQALANAVGNGGGTIVKAGAGTALNVYGGSSDGVAVNAVGGATNGVALYGSGAGSGAGVHGVSTGTGHGVEGVANSTGHGVRGTATTTNGISGVATSGNAVRGDASTGNGVYGVSSSSGYGVVAASTTGIGLAVSSLGVVHAAMHIEPQASQPSGPNTVGDIYVTAAGLLKICTVAGTPGTWISVGAQ